MELLFIRGIAPDATYQFKHALIRDAAYEALLKSRRKELHRRVARAIDEKFPALKQTHPEVLARHWTEAGETEQAIAEWSRAGKSAQAHNAFREAERHYRDAITLLSTLPKSSECDSRELELRRSVVVLLNVTKGLAAPETVAAVVRTAALAEKSGNIPQILDSLIRRAWPAFFSGDLATACALADQALDLALREGTPTHLAGVYFLEIITRHFSGDLASAEQHFAAGCKFFDDPGFTQNPTAAAESAFAGASWNAWMLGRADIARDRMGQMRARVDREKPFKVASSEYYAAVLHLYMREYEQAETLAAQALKLSEKHQFPQFAAYSRCILGHALAQLGQAPEGIGLIRQGISGLAASGSGDGGSRWMTYLAGAQECDGASADALETVERALQVNPDELLYRPEALRLRGELRLKQRNTDLAKADFRDAIALAQNMSSKAWELRATTSLARLLAKQGKRDEARTMLADIYGWFTEGFDTVDLKDAKALLDQLSN